MEASSSTVTTDHGEIRRWIESRGGRPAAGAEPGMPRVWFPEEGEEPLRPISWAAFFEAFEARRLAFLHQDRTLRGGGSRYCRFVPRD